MKYLSVLTAVLSCFLLTSCTSDGSYPQVADAPPFDYVDGEELRSRMHQLAFALQNLDSSLATDYNETGPYQDAVVDNLEDIDRIAKTLQAGDLSSKHPFLAEDMSRFISDVERAQFDAERRHYYMAGRITGACVACHRSVY